LSAFGAAPYVKGQQPPSRRPKRIGLISDQPSKLPATETPGWKPFLSALSDEGWTLGKNLKFGPEYREMLHLDATMRTIAPPIGRPRAVKSLEAAVRH
jgi:hypothetical protein